MIDAQSVKPWEEMVFEDSYAEFRLQVQNYEGHLQYPSFQTNLVATYIITHGFDPNSKVG